MSAYPRGNRWYVEYTDAAGKRQRRSTNARTRKEAEALERELRVRTERQELGLEARDRNPNRWTLRQAVEWWIDAVARHQAQHESAKTTLRKHVTGDFAALPFDQVTTARVARWLDEKADELSPATVNGLRALLMGVFTKATKRGHYLGENPVRGTERLEVEARTPRTLPPHAVRALLDGVDDEPWRTIIWIAAHTGMRRSEILRISPASVDLRDGVIHVSRTKKKRPRVVPIHHDLRPVLEAALGRRLAITSQDVHRSARYVREALKGLGVALPEVDDASFKALRASWASRMVECGASRDLVRLMGWGAKSGDVMETYYLNVGVEALRVEIEKLTWPRADAGNVVGIKRGKT